jgi:predicted secreted protein
VEERRPVDVRAQGGDWNVPQHAHGAGVFTGSAAEGRLKASALSGVLDDYRLSFEGGETMTGKFLVTRLDYAGDFNGERNYTLSLESSGAVVSA